MKNTEEEFTTLAIKIGVTVAVFLLNTGWAIKAIELCQECFILLNNGDLSADSPIAKSFDERIRTTVKRAWLTLWNSSGSEEYFRKLSLQPKEGKKFYELVINLMKTAGKGQREAECYRRLGELLWSSGEHDNGKE